MKKGFSRIKPEFIVTQAPLRYLGGSPLVALAPRRSSRASAAPVPVACPTAPCVHTARRRVNPTNW